MQKYFPDAHTGKPFMIYVWQKFFIYFQSPRQRYNYFSYFFNSSFSVAFMQQTGKKQLQKSFPENKKRYPIVSYKVKQYRVLTCPKIWEQVFSSLLLWSIFQKFTPPPSYLRYVEGAGFSEAQKKTASLTECGFSVLSRMANFCRSLLRDQNLWTRPKPTWAPLALRSIAFSFSWA